MLPRPRLRSKNNILGFSPRTALALCSPDQRMESAILIYRAVGAHHRGDELALAGFDGKFPIGGFVGKDLKTLNFDVSDA